MPNRIIKDSIHTSDTVNMMSDFQFRLWVNLITYVDDYGRGDARPAIIKGACFPLRERLSNADISKALQELAGIGCIFLYEVGGNPYLCFPTWESHQSVRNKKSRFPAPSESCSDSQAIESNCKQLNANVHVIQSNPIQSESNPNTNPNPNPNIRARFAPPTFDEVKQYCEERQNGIDPHHFMDYYQSQKWRKANGQPLSDWKAAIRTWEQKRKQRPPGYRESTLDRARRLEMEGAFDD